MMMNTADSWILTWGLSYIACSIVKPDIFGDVTPLQSRMINLVDGVVMLAGLGLALLGLTIGRVILGIEGVIEVIGGVASWSGVINWNVPFKDKAPFNISMGVADLVSALALFSRAIR